MIFDIVCFVIIFLPIFHPYGIFVVLYRCFSINMSSLRDFVVLHRRFSYQYFIPTELCCIVSSFFLPIYRPYGTCFVSHRCLRLLPAFYFARLCLPVIVP